MDLLVADCGALSAGVYSTQDARETGFLIQRLLSAQGLGQIDVVLRHPSMSSFLTTFLDLSLKHLANSKKADLKTLNCLVLCDDILAAMTDERFAEALKQLVLLGTSIHTIDVSESDRVHLEQFVVLRSQSNDSSVVLHTGSTDQGSAHLLTASKLAADVDSYSAKFRQQSRLKAARELNLLTSATLIPAISGQYNVEQRLSITDVFGENIVLRNLEPKRSTIRGLAALRSKLSIPEGITPRKNEVLYASVVESFVHDVSNGAARHVLYVGDSHHNDGNAILNLTAISGLKVLGFLCNDQRKNERNDLCVGNIIFSTNWANLGRLYSEARRRRFPVGPKLVAIFDLDQTVYAAKGRHDGPLKAARLEAVYRVLQPAIPPEMYNVQRLEHDYHFIDQDKFHSLTKDNQDYVVFLTLTVALGLHSLSDIESCVKRGTPIATIIESAMPRFEQAARAYSLQRALNHAREVFFNMRACDQTPFKSFREQEYAATKARMMKTELGTPLEAITLGREVLSLALFLKSRGALLLALSDRPIEATEPDSVLSPDANSLLRVPMSVLGNLLSFEDLDARKRVTKTRLKGGQPR